MSVDGLKNRVRAIHHRIRNRYRYHRHETRSDGVEIETPRNVLIVTVDCLRNDRLSRPGHERETTPFLDQMSGYTPAITAAPWTFSAVPSILTGLYPHKHGAVYPNNDVRHEGMEDPPHGVSSDVATLADLLATSGYETRLVTAIGTAELPVEGRFKTAIRKHLQPAEDVLEAAKSWWNRTEGPKFGYVQLGDLHAKLQNPRAEHFGEIPDIEGVRGWRFQQSTEPKAEFRRFRDARGLLYDTVLRDVDGAIASFLDAIDEREETVIFVTSDHGEEFWEFASFERENFDDPRGIAGIGHGHALVPPVLEVPILSDTITFAESKGMASTTDIVPTILRELDATVETDFDGVPLQDGTTRPVLAEEVAYGSNQLSVTHEGDHLIHVPARDRSFLLDYESGSRREDVDRQSALTDLLPDSRAVGSSVSLTEGTRRQLSDLGYTE